MKTIRFGLCACMAFAVAAHGAVEPWSEFALTIGAATLLLVWAVMAARSREVELQRNPLFVPLVVFGAFVLAQWLLELSTYRYLTQVELLKLGTYLVLFFLAVQAFRVPEEARGLVWFLLVLPFAAALFGIIQHYTFNGKLYWVRELRFGGIPFGPYVNRNHFAGLMELTLPLGLAILFLRGVRRDQLPLAALFTLLPMGALFLSASRGGIVGFGVEAVLLATFAVLRPAGRTRLIAMTAVLALLVGGLLVWLDAGSFLQRFTQFGANEVTHDRRLIMAKDTWRVFLAHPWLGTGLGTLVAVYPAYETYHDGKVVDHAHNDYVELLAETGVIGGLFALVFLVLLFRIALLQLGRERLPFSIAARLGALVGCAGILVHSVVDFNLHLPSHAIVFLILAAVATSRVSSTTSNLFAASP